MARWNPEVVEEAAFYAESVTRPTPIKVKC